MSDNAFDVLVYETFDHGRKDKENDDVGQLLLASLDKFTKDRNNP